MTYIDRPAGLDAPLWTPMARNPKMHRFWGWGESTNPCNRRYQTLVRFGVARADLSGRSAARSFSTLRL